MPANVTNPHTRSVAGMLLVGGATALSIGYVVLRYNVLGPVPWKDLPLYVLNKGFSLAAFTLLSLNFALGPLTGLGVAVPSSWLAARSSLGRAGFVLTALHVAISFLLFTPSVYPDFFDSDRTVTLLAGVSMLTGVLAFVALWGYSERPSVLQHGAETVMALASSRAVRLGALLLGGLHVLCMGYPDWLEPQNWHGGLPPVSLVAFVIFTMSYVVNLTARE